MCVCVCDTNVPRLPPPYCRIDKGGIYRALAPLIALARPLTFPSPKNNDLLLFESLCGHTLLYPYSLLAFSSSPPTLSLSVWFLLMGGGKKPSKNVSS